MVRSATVERNDVIDRKRSTLVAFGAFPFLQLVQEIYIRCCEQRTTAERSCAIPIESSGANGLVPLRISLLPFGFILLAAFCILLAPLSILLGFALAVLCAPCVLTRFVLFRIGFLPRQRPLSVGLRDFGSLKTSSLALSTRFSRAYDATPIIDAPRCGVSFAARLSREVSRLSSRPGFGSCDSIHERSVAGGSFRNNYAMGY